MPVSAKSVRTNWLYYVKRATLDSNGCLILWKSAGSLPRWIYEGFHSKVLPFEIKCCHSCDNPNCINVAHIFEGTQKENVQDAMNKKRMFLQSPEGKATIKAHLNDPKFQEARVKGLAKGRETMRRVYGIKHKPLDS